MKKQTIALSNPHPILGGTEVFEAFRYSPAVRAGDLLFVAGQVGLRPDGSVPNDVSEQIELAFVRLGAVLEAAGARFDDLVEIVSYHVGMEQLATFREIKDRYVRQDFPTWTILGVATLARSTLKVEIKAVAYLPENRKD